MFLFLKNVMNTSEKIALMIVLFSFVIGIYFYPLMPEEMVVGWDIRGQPDFYLPKIWAIFIIPIALAGFSIFFFLAPKTIRLKGVIQEFGIHYDGFVILVVVLLFYLYLLLLSFNIGIRFGIFQLMAPAFGLLFCYISILCRHVKRNWFIGIRTPWTLKDDKVWAKTHKFGSKLFMGCGIIAFLGIISEQYALFFIFIPIVVTSISAVIYSWFEYRKIIECKS